MPKLPKNIADQVDEQEAGGFDPLEPGKYEARLREVSVSDDPGPSGAHYWNWEYEVLDEPYKGRRLWNTTSLSEKAFFKFKESFDAFGVSPDTDTDELCGKTVKLAVSKRVISSGSRKGEMGNNVDAVLPADAGGSGGDAAEDDDEDLF